MYLSIRNMGEISRAFKWGMGLGAFFMAGRGKNGNLALNESYQVQAP